VASTACMLFPVSLLGEKSRNITFLSLVKKIVQEAASIGPDSIKEKQDCGQITDLWLVAAYSY
jgi:hypothetical protein